jgi:hypothetical protein
LITVDELIKGMGPISPTPQEKNIFVELWCEDYARAKGKNPSSYELTRLADWLLSDVLSDPSRSKVQNTEYPILSKPQLERRYRELSMESEMVDVLHQRKINNQPTRKKDAKNNEY